MWWLLWAVPTAALAVFVCLLLIRAMRFTPPAAADAQAEPLTVDTARATDTLAALVRCKTVSYRDKSLEDEAEFQRLISLLPTLYPNVARTVTMEQLPDRALLFHWRGREAGAPTVLMAHYDVVPASAELWSHDPFDATVRDGYLWGRGTLDTKVTMNGILLAADTLIAEGFTPKCDVYFAFSGGEEVNGEGAVRIVEHFAERGIEPSLVLDEGGAVVEGVFPGVKAPCGLIGIAEKGMMDVRYTARSTGGHASAPKPNAPVDRLCRVCDRVLKKPPRMHLTAPVAQMFDTLGRHSSFVYRLIFANLFVFAPVLNLLAKKSGGEMNALLRTTVAFTQMQGSAASNVIPPEASLVSNIRLNPADTMDGMLTHLTDCADDASVTLSVMAGMNPSRISRTDTEGYERVAAAVRDTWRGCIVSPYLMVQCSDARHWGRISDRVYRFSAMDLTSAERATIHGNDERIRIDCLARSVEFFLRLIRSC